MKKNIHMLLVAVIALIACSCSEKSSAIGQLESFTQELREHSEEYDAKDWVKAEQRYNEIFDRLDQCKGDLTQEEIAKIGELNDECAKYYALAMVKLSKKGIEMAGDLLESAGDLVESTGDLVNDVGETAEKLDDLFN